MLIAATGLARAQEQTFRPVKTTPGKLLRLGLVGNVTKECTPGPLPEIQVATQHSNGTLAIRSGKSKAGSLARYPNLEVPMQGIFYQANSGFTGTDPAEPNGPGPGGSSIRPGAPRRARTRRTARSPAANQKRTGCGVGIVAPS